MEKRNTGFQRPAVSAAPGHHSASSTADGDSHCVEGWETVARRSPGCSRPRRLKATAEHCSTPMVHRTQQHLCELGPRRPGPASSAVCHRCGVDSAGFKGERLLWSTQHASRNLASNLCGGRRQQMSHLTASATRWRRMATRASPSRPGLCVGVNSRSKYRWQGRRSRTTWQPGLRGFDWLPPVARRRDRRTESLQGAGLQRSVRPAPPIAAFVSAAAAVSVCWAGLSGSQAAPSVLRHCVSLMASFVWQPCSQTASSTVRSKLARSKFKLGGCNTGIYIYAFPTVAMIARQQVDPDA